MLPVDLLCHVSTYFKAALKGGFEEAREKWVTLKDADPSAFELFVLWLYKGRLFKLDKFGEVNMVVVKAWVLGDRLGASSFQDCIMKALLAKSRGQGLLVKTETIRYIYDNTTAASPLRRATVDTVVYVYEEIDPCSKSWKSLLSEGGDLVVDLMKELKKCWEPLYDGPAELMGDYLLKS